MSKKIPESDPASQDLDPERALSLQTPSGRTYKNKRWTLGSSTHLVEGEEPESPLVSIAWIAIPVLLGLLTIWVLTR